MVTVVAEFAFLSHTRFMCSVQSLNKFLSPRCSELASHWLSSLGGSGGCDMLGALRVAFRLKQVDTVCVVVSGR